MLMKNLHLVAENSKIKELINFYYLKTLIYFLKRL